MTNYKAIMALFKYLFQPTFGFVWKYEQMESNLDL